MLINNFYPEILAYGLEKRHAYLFGREQEIRNYIRWCGAVKNNMSSPLVITGNSGTGKSTMLHLMREIVTSDTPHPYCIERGWVNDKEYDDFVYQFKAMLFLQSSQDNIYENILNYGRPRSGKEFRGMGVSILGTGGDFSVASKTSVLTSVGKMLNKLTLYRKQPVVFFIDTVTDLGYDLGNDIKYIHEFALGKEINNLHFVISVNQPDYNQSDYFRNKCTTIKLEALSYESLCDFANFVAESNQLSISSDNIVKLVKNCDGSINNLKKLINKHVEEMCNE